MQLTPTMLMVALTMPIVIVLTASVGIVMMCSIVVVKHNGHGKGLVSNNGGATPILYEVRQQVRLPQNKSRQ